MTEHSQSALHDAVQYFLRHNILCSDSMASCSDAPEHLHSIITEKIHSPDFLIINKDIITALSAVSRLDLNWKEFDRSRALLERQHPHSRYHQFISFLGEDHGRGSSSSETAQAPQSVIVRSSYQEKPKKREVQDFTDYFNRRFEAIETILRQRRELSNLTSIRRILLRKERSQVSFIGMVQDKQLTKNKNIILTVEDQTGSIKVVINKNKPELFTNAESIVYDEVIGVTGVNGDKIVFANNVFWPDIPAEHNLKKADDECYVVFISDIHVGSKNFLELEFRRFLEWLNGKSGNSQQRHIASLVKYLFIAGDIVDGCGIYPGQEKELAIDDIYRQYEAFASFLEQIPDSINIIICPGNHDAMRLAEPQPALSKKFLPGLFASSRITFVSNPSLVNIHASEGFSGFDVLLYHGMSFDYYANNVESLRKQGGYTRADLLMRFLLQRRHLAPTHISVSTIPDASQDPLVISTVPDFFITGHIHYTIAANYRTVSMINCSCWQSMTSFQEKLGHTPQPARVPLVNLRTREIKILRF